MTTVEKYALVPYDTYLSLLKQTKHPLPQQPSDGQVNNAPLNGIQSGGSIKSHSNAPPPGLPLNGVELDPSNLDGVKQIVSDNWASHWQSV
jgi:hypothetical protein